MPSPAWRQTWPTTATKPAPKSIQDTLQLGNAVPVMLARVVASSVATQLLLAQGQQIDSLNQKLNQPERVAA